MIERMNKPFMKALVTGNIKKGALLTGSRDEDCLFDDMFNKQEYKEFGSITDLNSTLCAEDQFKVVNRYTFKKMHRPRPSSTLDGLVARIRNIVSIANGYDIEFHDGTHVTVFFNGGIRKNYGYIKCRYSSTDTHSRIVNLLGYNTSLFAEKLIGICKSWIDDELPVSFTNLVVNVKDGSGAKNTANRLGIPVDLNPNNLEWTIRNRNSCHGGMLIGMAKRTGRVYRFSANDVNIPVKYDVKDDDALRDYMDAHYPVVREYRGEV